MDSTSGANMSSLQTPIFTRNNYEYWSLTMKALFRGQDVLEIVHHGYAEPTNKTSYNNLTQAEKYALGDIGRKMEKLYSIYTRP